MKLTIESQQLEIQIFISFIWQWQDICPANVGLIKRPMNRTYLGEFEEIVLLAVAVTRGQAYGVVLMHDIAGQTGRTVQLNQVYSALQRLEEKGMVKSEIGGATAERGGRRKRLYTITVYGERTLQQIQEVRSGFWSKLTNLVKLTAS